MGQLLISTGAFAFEVLKILKQVISFMTISYIFDTIILQLPCMSISITVNTMFSIFYLMVYLFVVAHFM